MRLCVQLVLTASTVLANLAATPLWAQGRIVEDVVASEQRGYVSVTLLFGCSMRYVSHTPATDGDAVQIRFSAGPDCGRTSASEPQPLLAGAAGYVRSVDVVRPFGSEVQIRIGWSKPETFVLTPSIDGRLLRVRLLRTEAPQVTVTELPRGVSTYAVNLASSTTPFTPDALAAAAKVVGTRTYVSETVVDEQRWYRLRAGPFVNEAAAKQALVNSRGEFPRAWVAISDDDTLNEVGTPSGVATVRSTAPQVNASLTPDEIKRTLAQARDAFRHKDYATAIPLLTQLTQQPEFPQRADAQEMLALARERSGQVAHAKAEYEDYLQRYPTGDGSTRVRKRLQALAWASRPGRNGATGNDEDESPWRVYGGFSQIYRQDQSHIESGLAVSDQTTQNALLTDVSLVARRHGERFDFTTRASAGYSYDMLNDGPGSESRVTMMFAEFADRVAGWYARLGRQAGGSGGLMGTFDGMQAGYQLWPRLRVNGFFGYPVDSTREGPDQERKFVGVSADVGTLANAWDLSFYAVDQQYSGVTDRQAVGTEVRYFRPGITMVGLADFDIHYSTLNTVLLLGTFTLPARWTLNLNLDHRKSPGLSTRNAMIGQPVRRFDELFGLFSPQEIEQLALDRTSESKMYSAGVSRPLGERWQWSLDASTMTLGSTRESGGVAATPSSGTDTAVSTQVMGYGLFGRGDVTSLGLQYQTGESAQLLSLGVGTQLPIGERWRVGPRLRLDQRKLESDRSTSLVYSPALRVEMRGKHLTFEVEGGAEIGTRDLGTSSEDASRYYFSLGYRYDF
ncbi:MAG: SPOR domain-containing protein [Steroidobacteraceae bacterium]|nr:SPOR domain-containing protein [Steroidobacteraceae bacterium]